MEEDEEIHSPQRSPDSESPASSTPPRPPSNGRITVTVASAPPQALPTPPQSHSHHHHHNHHSNNNNNNNNTLTLALPIQQPRSAGSGAGGSSGGGGGGREDCWSESATAVLIDAWGERYLQLSRGNLKQKHWKEVADIVSSREDYRKTPKTDIQCKNRIDTVKKKYKLEKARIATGGGSSKWPFFDKLDHLIGPTAKIPLAALPKVPVGIPRFQMFKKRGGVETDSDSELEAEERDSMDSLPPPVMIRTERKRPRMVVMGGRGGGNVERKERGGGGGGGWGNAVRELTQAILRFGEAYEQAESAKLQQVVEMEKQRMKFAKELELQRMQFFMKTQLEISQLKHGGGGGKRGGGGGGGGGVGNASNHHR
ncbi:hypothetical protein ACJW30_05G008700 [Castanea mollissima]